jgi:hypothetical protein
MVQYVTFRKQNTWEQKGPHVITWDPCNQQIFAINRKKKKKQKKTVSWPKRVSGLGVNRSRKVELNSLQNNFHIHSRAQVKFIPKIQIHDAHAKDVGWGELSLLCHGRVRL